MTDTNDAPKRRTKSVNRDPAFDIALGAHIRSARMATRMSLSTLGAAVGVSYQQMQKYEAGKDRISVSTLTAIAAALRVHPGSFFGDDLPAPRTHPTPAPRGTLSDLRSAQRIGERIERLGDPGFVRRLMALVDAVADSRDSRGANGRALDANDP